MSQFDQIKELTALKAEFDFLREVPHHPLVQTVMDLHKAFTNFFEGRARFPTFRRKGQNDSFRYPDPKQIKIEGERERVFLPKAGWTRIVMHRPIIGTVKNVTVSAVAGDWFASIQVVHEVTIVPFNRGGGIGIDLGGVQPIVQSDGTIVDMPRIAKKEKEEIGDRSAQAGAANEGLAQPGQGPAPRRPASGEVRKAPQGRPVREEGEHSQ